MPPGEINAFPLPMHWDRFFPDFSTRPLIMGILNVTPDSFSDGGRFFSPDTAVAHARKLVLEGADILDIGGESTRPFSDAVDAAEEIRRVVPVIAAVAPQIDIPISIDTTKARVADAALNAGAAMINDVSALRLDPDMAPVAASANVPIVLMHMLGTPKTMQKNPRYRDVVEDVRTFLDDAMDRAVRSGVSPEKLIVDPGIGFGKTLTHNLLLIKHLDRFLSLKAPVLIGPSRKAFIRTLLKPDKETDINVRLPLVETGTQAAIAAAVLNGAHIVRVHDVAGTAATLKIITAVKRAS